MEKKEFIQAGLTSVEATEKLKKFGLNQLEPTKKISTFKIFLDQFTSPLVYILVIAGLITLFLREFTDSLIIFAAVFLNTLLGFYQEKKAQRALEALRTYLVQKVRVVRDSRVQLIDARQLVPGDVVILSIGVKVPADGLIIEGVDLSVNEAILTGESIPVKKTKVKNRMSEISTEDRFIDKIGNEYRVFAGTTVVTGIGKMLVTGTGMKTEIGKIGQAVGEVGDEKTPLQDQLAQLAKTLTIILGITCILIFIIGLRQSRDPIEMFKISVAVAVAAIPEGLVVTLTAILAIGMQRILARKALVRKLIAAETLGSVSVICADKTGTLTEGKMRVVEALINDQLPDSKQVIIQAAILCNDKRDPLETAMLQWAEKKLKKKNVTIKDIEKRYLRTDEVPFSSEKKYIATLHKIKNGPKIQNLLFVSGAPEMVLKMSRITAKEEKSWLENLNDYANKSYRLVGFAFKEIEGKENWKKEIGGFSWLGILVFEDPIRKGVEDVIQLIKNAGVDLKVITGDYLNTAASVFNRLKIRDGPLQPEEMITGEELDGLSQQELKDKVKKIILFARTSPQQKLKIVNALKENAEVVAMMGDGVNDAPALAKSDIAIVVNEASDVAKETADMVLLDSRFETIVYAIEEGRAIFENIKKVILYLLCSSFTEVILIGGSMLFGLPLPVSAAQILWVNLVEDSLPSIALAFEPEEKEVMDEPPRPRNFPILDLEMKTLIFIVGFFTDLLLLMLAYLLHKNIIHFSHGRSVVFIALGIDSLFYVFSCRSLRKPIWQKKPWENKLLVLSVFIGLWMLVLAIYYPPLKRLLKTESLEWSEWVFIFFLSMFKVLLIEITKYIFILGRKKV
ncbi:MAG TPA: HAD-IC family P-type ATPase [Candidatus Bathyarchaeia archaeon]|nr:HAD-IC family P-type ATPase [Candidatus Bathyarchaeia archaeon]